MITMSLLSILGYLEIILCISAFCFLVTRKQGGEYLSLGCFLAVRIASNVILAGVNFFAEGHTLHKQAIYNVYFYVYWISFAAESIIALIVVYSIFKLAMAPLKGLQALGMLVFKWAAGISVAVALGSAFTPGLKGADLLVSAISQLQRTQSILTLCLLLFVCHPPDGTFLYESHLWRQSRSWYHVDERPCAVRMAHVPFLDGYDLQCDQRHRCLCHFGHMDCIFRPARAKASYHRPANDVTLPPLEPDLTGAR